MRIIHQQPRALPFRHRVISASGALSPSMLNTPSVTTSCCPGQGSQQTLQMLRIVMGKAT
jgi:hypothetical protein